MSVLERYPTVEIVIPFRAELSQAFGCRFVCQKIVNSSLFLITENIKELDFQGAEKEIGHGIE